MRFLLWAVLAATGEGQTLVDLRTQTKSVDFSGATSTKPMQTGSSLPATCQFFSWPAHRRAAMYMRAAR
jgi:hypothetical protein